MERLEHSNGIPTSIEEQALSILSDSDMGLLCEFIALLKSGYSLEQIAEMMGQECYEVACDAIMRADQEYWRLMRPPRRFISSDIAPEKPPRKAHATVEDP